MTNSAPENRAKVKRAATVVYADEEGERWCVICGGLRLDGAGR